jgi:hypothetical protein
MPGRASLYEDYPGYQYSGAHLLRGSLRNLQWTGDAAVLYLIDKSAVGMRSVRRIRLS